MGKPDLMLEINIPAPGLRPGAGFLHAYTESLCRELEACVDDLSEYDIKTVYIRGAGGPNDLDLRVLTRKLRMSLAISESEKVVEIAPQRISTANFFTYQNFHTDLYRISLDTLNYPDFCRLKLNYEYNHYTWIQKLLSYSNLTSVCIELLFGIEGQNEASMTDSLNRVMGFNPDKVSFKPADRPSPDGAGRLKTTDPAVLLETADAYLLERGYHRTSVYEYAKQGMDSVHTMLQNTDCAYWGLGVGAVTFTDGCILTNTSDPDKYISAAGDPEKLVDRAVRLDDKSLAQNYIIRRLNAAEGLDMGEMESRFGGFVSGALDSLENENLVRIADGRAVLTNLGAAYMPRVRRIISGVK